MFGMYSVDAWGAPVGAGATAPRYCSMGGVVKIHDDEHPFTIANEFICGRLGLLMGLPIPPGVVVKTDDGKPAYVSLRFGKAGERPPPADFNHLAEDKPQIAAGVVAFDTWIHNGDRHHENLAYSRVGIDPIVYDHSHALLGPGTDAGRLSDLSVTPAVAQLGPLLLNDSDLSEWAAVVNGIPNVVVESICRTAESAADVDSAAIDAAINFLLHRKSKILDLLKQDTNTLPNIQWGLAA